MTRQRVEPEAGPLGDQIDYVRVAQLRLDPHNPRLPKWLRSRGQAEILKYIEENYDPIVVGRSIALHGYFISEPLIVLKARGETYTVVEGNRRLVALKLLTESRSRDLVSNLEWEELSAIVKLPARGIPVVIARDRDEIAPIIGYRHIAGIQEWDPFPKARYITQFVDEEEKSFTEVAEIVGETVGNVRRLYRNFAILEQADEEFNLDISRAAAEFGVFDRLVTGGVREYLGAPVPGAINEREFPLDPDAGERVALVLSWIFGDSDGNDSVISESRNASELSKALRSPAAVAVLTKTRDLTAALKAAEDPRERLVGYLSDARTGLRAALAELAPFAQDKDIVELVRACEASAAALAEGLE